MAAEILSPLRRGTSYKRTTVEEEIFPENDDEQERQQRRRQSDTFTSLKDKPVVLGGIADFSASDLVAHYTSCIKLSTENKINHKNAFNLQLIDYMASMLKKKDSSMNNFQVASCTLDASTKIYASRVDRAYMDGCKMASGLGVFASRKRQSQGAGKDDDDVEEGEMPSKKTKRTKNRPKKCIAKSAESLDGKIEADYRLDPMFMYMKTKFGDCQPGFINFVSRLALQGDCCELVMFPTEKYWQQEKQLIAENIVPLPPLPDLSDSIICSAFRGVFLDENANMEPFFDNKSEPQLDPDVDLDDNCFAPEIDDVNDVNDVVDGVALQEAIDEEEKVMNKVKRETFDIISLRNHLSSKNQEYSYFNTKKLSLWAGPQHWKVLPVNKEKAAVKAEPGKKERRPLEPLEFTSLEEVAAMYVKGRSLAISKRTTGRIWCVTKVTNPSDEHYDGSNLTRLFLRKGFGQLNVWNSREDSTVKEEEEEIAAYDYNNLNDSQNYCPAVADDDDNEEYGTPEECPQVKPADETRSSLTESTTWKLVTPPTQIAPVFVPYSMKEKKLDMKKLKGAIWELLGDEGNKENIDQNSRNKALKMFSKMNFDLRRSLPPNMVQELSCAIMFTALLHLANEKILQFKGDETLTDFEILKN